MKFRLFLWRPFDRDPEGGAVERHILVVRLEDGLDEVAGLPHQVLVLDLDGVHVHAPCHQPYRAETRLGEVAS